MATVYDDPTLPPRYVVEHYRKVYHTLYRREPLVRYMGNHWFYVDGETVHRKTLLDEIARLRALTQQAQTQQRVSQLRYDSATKKDKGVIKRLIDRLRNL